MTRRALAAFLIAVIAACSDTPPDDSPRWVRVARDPNYTIYIDTGRIGPFDVQGSRRDPANAPGMGWGSAYEVWYRTDHAQPRVHDKTGKTFNREVVHSIIQCDSLKFRVASVDMSMGSGRVVVQQRLTMKELQHQVWHRVELGSSEELAARAACHFVRSIATVRR